MLKAPKLNQGDRVATVTLSWGGPGACPHRYEAGKRQLQEEFAVEIVEMPHTLRDPDWLAKNPKARADDLMEAFSDSTIKAVISTIGGDDSIRTLKHLDLNIFRENPKIFLGYSDTTVTHLACFKAGLISFYGPSIMSGFAENTGMFPYMVKSVRQTLFSPKPIGEVPSNRDGWTVEHLKWENPENQGRKRRLNSSEGWNFLQGDGVFEGHLVGGCLEVMEWLRGTSVWPDHSQWDGAILFLETSEEGAPPESVIRALRVYAAQGILNRLSGIIIGRPGGQIPHSEFPKYDDAVQKVIVEEEGLDHLPIVTQMDFGHTDPMFILPYGITARIDCEQRKFFIVENAVEDN